MRTRDREEFIARMAEAGLPLDVSRAFLRLGTTLHRLAEAQCNGDWPADNGQRKVIACTECQMCWVPSSMVKGRCPDCRTTARALALGQAHGLEVEAHGDPRGAVLVVKVPAREPGRPPRELVAG